jgi:hypothetical protein
VGRIYSGARLSHVDENGDVYIYFRTQRYEIFEEFQKNIKNCDLSQSMTERPYPIDKATIYLSFYDSSYYRCRVVDILEDGLKVFYIKFNIL